MKLDKRSIDKKLYRQSLLEKRRAISQERRKEAAFQLSLFLKHLLPFDQVFSFSSFKYEIDTILLNQILSREGRLFLPKMENGSLSFYSEEKKGVYSSSTAILVPAVAFDLNHNRLGYGKGYYDRYLSQIPYAQTFGIGFKEQLVERLPIEPHDIPLNSVHLF